MISGIPTQLLTVMSRFILILQSPTLNYGFSRSNQLKKCSILIDWNSKQRYTTGWKNSEFREFSVGSNMVTLVIIDFFFVWNNLSVQSILSPGPFCPPPLGMALRHSATMPSISKNLQRTRECNLLYCLWFSHKIPQKVQINTKKSLFLQWSGRASNHQRYRRIRLVWKLVFFYLKVKILFEK